eukprot:s877_g7.t2
MCFPATKLLSPFRLGVPSTFSIQFSLESFVGQLLLLQESSSAEALLTVVIVATALLPVVWTEGRRIQYLGGKSQTQTQGGDCASLNITNLWQKFMPGSAPPKELGENREWNVDLIPKFIMASGDLVKILLKTKVSRYLEWKSCEGTYVYQYQEAGLFSGAKYIHKVPATATDGLKSPLMGMLEKPRFINFAQFIMNWEDDKPGTHQDIDPRRHTMAQVYQKFGLQESTIDFIGHAVALHPNDSYLNGPCGPTIQKCRLYLQSVLQYGGSPFIYPIYGLGGLPEGFSRLAAIHRGTYMLNKSVDGFAYDDTGKVCGVKSGDEVAKEWPTAKRHKSVPCRHYSRGFCQLGDNCNFLHEPSLVVGPPRVVPPPTRAGAPTLPASVPVPVAVPVAAAEGAAEQAPQHDLGETAQSVAPASGAPTYRKSKLCIHHTNGYCSRGSTCNFAHGEHELGTPQPSASGAAWPALSSGQQGWQSNGWQSNGWQSSNWQSNSWQANGWQANAWQKLGFAVKGGLRLSKRALGEKCNFAHDGPPPRRSFPDGWVVRTKEEIQLYNFKTTLCRDSPRDFEKVGSCPRGDECTFAHGAAELQKPGEVQQTLSSLQSGPKAQFTTEEKQRYNYKTKLCREFSANGSCPRGDICSFAHGQEELQKPGPQLGLETLVPLIAR